MGSRVSRAARAATHRRQPRPSSEAATYVYCLVHGPRPPSTRGVPDGVPRGEAPRVVAAGRSLHAVVSSVPLDAFGEAAIARGFRDLTWVSECAVGHERVVERFLGRGTVVPMKLFTIFTSDARALEHIGRERGAIDRLVRRLKDRVEVGVRVSFRPALVTAPASRRALSGAEYLRAKRSVREATVELSARAQARVEEIFETCARLASESTRRPVLETPSGGGRVLLDAAYLVPVKAIAGFRTGVRALARQLASEGYHIALTGPWPAYNFIGPRA